MDIPRYRIGNDLTVLWAISNNDGTPYDLSGKEVRLYVTNERGMSRVEPTIVQDENSSVTNIIRWVFLGDNQKVLGKHTLTVEILTSDEHRKIKRDICDAFTLVSRSEEEETGGEGNALDSGAIYLSTKLDVYRFGNVRVEIGTNGNWFIDGTDTGRSALAGEKGIVNKIYQASDLGKDFDTSSVVDTFNAQAINEVYKGLKNLTIKELRDLSLADLEEYDVLTFNGQKWLNFPFRELINIFKLSVDISDDDNDPEEVEQYWYRGYDGKVHIDDDIVVHGNAIIEGDTASGGAGEDITVGLDEQAVLDLLEREKYVTEDDIAGLVPEVDLSDYYKATQVDDLLSKKANTQDVYTKEELNPYKAWWDKVMAHLTVDENGNVTIDTNLIVSGDTASGGAGQDNPVGIQGIKLNGQTYTDYDGDGVIDLGTISGGGGDLDLDTLETYLSDNKYINADNLDTYGVATQSWVEGKNYLTSSALNGYATQSWVNEQGFAKASALSSYQPLSTAINTGNIGSQSVSHATTTNRFKYIASSGDLNTVLAGGGLARTYSNYMSNIFTNAPSGMRYGMVLQLSAASAGAEALSGQLAWDVNHASTSDVTRYLWWRASDSTNGFTYGKWHQIAFMDSNVASAQQLAHSNGTVGAVVNSSGYVGIGVDNPLYKLDIGGDSRISGNLIVAGDVASGGAGQEVISVAEAANRLVTPRSIWGQSFDGTGNVTGALYMPNNTSIYMRKADGTTSYGVIYLSTNNSLVIGNDVASNGFTTLLSGNDVRLRYGTSRTNGLILNSSGNVGIGVDNPQYKLDVAGAGRFTGSVTQGSDIRFKHRMNDVSLDLDVMANAPLFSFYWNDRADNQIHIGTSAQYWEIHRNELVSGIDFKGLDYSTLGVAMGISLAKKVKELEAKIKYMEERYGEVC